MQAQGVKAKRVLRLSLAPSAIWKTFQDFEADLVPWFEASLDKVSSYSFGVLRTDVGSLQDRCLARDGTRVLSRSFAKAAVQLGISRSRLSETIRGLEDRLGVRLLNRLVADHYEG
jgi:hypothetical protein